jgi:glycosyltransferase involved in cell wall biosynthesis
MGRYENYSVLLTVYYKEKAEYFSLSLESIVSQTLPTNDFVIVCDGPLSEELNDVLKSYQSKYSYINVVRLPENRGSGYASMEGLKHIKNEVLAKMDSDDIALSDRMEKELAKINEGYDVVGGAIAEFESDPNVVEAVKYLPEKQEDIIKYSRKRNPIANVTVMYKKSMIEAVGGYNDLIILEDYTLAVKLIMSGAKVTNLQEVMVKVRSNRAQMVRRTTMMLYKNLKNLRKFMLLNKYISKREYHLYNFETWVFCIIPPFMKKFVYKIFLRRKK